MTGLRQLLRRTLWHTLLAPRTRLDHAHRLLVKRYGEASIEMLFDGSAIPWIR